MFLKELKHSQWLDTQQLEQFQLTRLKKLLCHCNDNVPYYRKLFTAKGFKPETITNLEQFSCLPTLDKPAIRDNIEDLKSRNLSGNLVQMSTGGSCGTPLIFWVDRDRLGYDKALRLRNREWWGIGSGDREAVFWGSPIELSKQDRLKKIRDMLVNSRLFSAFEMTEDNMRRYCEEIRQYKPRHIFGYPGSLYAFARFAQDHNLNLADLGVKVIFATGEMLYDFQRALIQKIFSAPVAAEYGARDVGFIAQECPKASMHISENIIVEADDSGELILTNLDSYGMPFIRYRSGDIGKVTHSSCACGRKLKILEKIQGRANDMLKTPSGRLIHPAIMNHIFRNIEGIREFQVIQKNIDYLVVNVARDGGYAQGLEEAIQEKITEYFGKIAIQVNFVNAVAPEKNGKFRYVISELAKEEIASALRASQ